MTEKIVKGRITHKHDVEANWLKAVNFIPKAGEIIIYDVDDKYNYPRFKTGDGITSVNNLPFCKSNAIEGVILDGNKLETDDNKNIIMSTPTFKLDDDGVLSIVSVSTSS